MVARNPHLILPLSLLSLRDSEQFETSILDRFSNERKNNNHPEGGVPIVRILRIVFDMFKVLFSSILVVVRCVTVPDAQLLVIKKRPYWPPVLQSADPLLSLV